MVVIDRRDPARQVVIPCGRREADRKPLPQD